jgi:uncharacterized protein (TIGR03067 family)
LLIATAGFLLAADGPKDDALKTEMGRLQGTWKLVRSEKNGKDSPMQHYVIPPYDLKLDGEKLTWLQPFAKPLACTLKLDPSQRPKTIDITWAEGPDTTKTFRGIYVINGDILKVCWDCSEKGEGRPEDFTTQDNPQYELSVWRKKLR